jgi:hypothetical protein
MNMNCRSELDEASSQLVVVDAEGAAHYHMMTGSVNWAIALGRHDIQHAVSALSYCCGNNVVAPPPRSDHHHHSVDHHHSFDYSGFDTAFCCGGSALDSAFGSTSAGGGSSSMQLVGFYHHESSRMTLQQQEEAPLLAKGSRVDSNSRQVFEIKEESDESDKTDEVILKKYEQRVWNEVAR